MQTWAWSLGQVLGWKTAVYRGDTALGPLGHPTFVDAQGGHFCSKELRGSLGPVAYSQVSDTAQVWARSPWGHSGHEDLPPTDIPVPGISGMWDSGGRGSSPSPRAVLSPTKPICSRGPGNLSCFGLLKTHSKPYRRLAAIPGGYNPAPPHPGDGGYQQQVQTAKIRASPKVPTHWTSPF